MTAHIAKAPQNRSPGGAKGDTRVALRERKSRGAPNQVRGYPDYAGLGSKAAIATDRTRPSRLGGNRTQLFEVEVPFQLVQRLVVDIA